MSDKKLRVGILGQGRSGWGIHAQWLQNARDQYEVVAVADLLPERRKDAKEVFGAKGYKRYTDLLKDKSLKLDLVVNALPSFLHPKGSIAALKAGHDVVSEKPAARTVKDFDKVVDTAKACKKHYLPFQNSRFQPFFQKMQEVIASGKLGRIVNVRSNWSGFARRWDWQLMQEFWGGNLLNTGPHPVDQAVMLFGKKMPKVFCRMKSIQPWIDAEDHCQVTLYGGEDDPIIDIVLSYFQAYPQGGDMYNISAEFGGICGGPGGLKWKYYDPKAVKPHKFGGTWSEGNRTYCQDCALPWVEEEWTPEENTDMFNLLSEQFYNNVYDVLVNKGKRVIQLAEVRRQIAVMEECHKQNKMPKSKKKYLKGKNV